VEKAIKGNPISPLPILDRPITMCDVFTSKSLKANPTKAKGGKACWRLELVKQQKFSFNKKEYNRRLFEIFKLVAPVVSWL